MWKRLFRLFRTNTRSSPAQSKPESLFSDDEIDPYNPFPEPVEIPISDVVDLHTIPARDVKRVVEEYLEQAYKAGFPVVRIIHGRGIGVQREIVRSILVRTPHVLKWTDAPPDAGGIGATLVSFFNDGDLE